MYEFHVSDNYHFALNYIRILKTVTFLHKHFLFTLINKPKHSFILPQDFFTQPNCLELQVS